MAKSAKVFASDANRRAWLALFDRPVIRKGFYDGHLVTYIETWDRKIGPIPLTTRSWRRAVDGAFRMWSLALEKFPKLTPVMDEWLDANGNNLLP